MPGFLEKGIGAYDVPIKGEPQESEKEVSFGPLRLALFIKYYGSWLSLLF
ncbi:hypothetical protein K413DRAFT_4100 [Clostridium sp. ASBs410]|jgi:hypothetical protein|nr:hypothetical protein K413DRAFT_4100 [Clostridium sp. ASBs410]